MKIDENLDVTSSFEKEIFNKSFDLSVDFAEIGVDLVTTSEIVNIVPGLKTIATFYSITQSINSRYNFKKILVFLKQFHTQQINPKALKKFRTKLDLDSKYRQEILETTLVLIEKFTDLEKSKILANLLSAHINEDLTWEEYCKITFILNQLNPSGYISLIKHSNKELRKSMTMLEYIEGESFLIACGIGTKFEDNLKITNSGYKLYKFGLKYLEQKYCV